MMNLVNQLEQSGLKATMNRLHVLKSLYEISYEITADALCRKINQDGFDVSLQTVYRVLSDLESKKIVRSIVLGREKNLFKINNSKAHVSVISSEVNEPIEFDRIYIQEKLSHFLKSMELDIESAELVIYVK